MCDRTISEDSFMLVYFLDKYKTQIMCVKAVDDCLSALKFIPDWLLTSKMIKHFLLLYTPMMIHSILMKILVKSYFIVMKWVFLV